MQGLSRHTQSWNRFHAGRGRRGPRTRSPPSQPLNPAREQRGPHGRTPTPARAILQPVLKELLLLLGAFVGATLLAVLLGAVNTGTALTFGQLAMAAAFSWIVVKGPG